MILPLCNMNTIHITQDFSEATIVGNKQHLSTMFLNLIKTVLKQCLMVVP